MLAIQNHSLSKSRNLTWMYMPGKGSWIDICYKPFWNDGLEFAIAPAAIKYLHKSLDIPWNNFGWKLSVGGGVCKNLSISQILNSPSLNCCHSEGNKYVQQTAIENNGKRFFINSSYKLQACPSITKIIWISAYIILDSRAYFIN